ncbi:phytoene desaturase family protein [uncultured Jatrophihabitans sp.]|uniref:phytoene desaturase family protein n=1 Tax=uncultured Jatrophihabitans sp. TaxID=1610747 RepID=UPI0035C9597E
MARVVVVGAGVGGLAAGIRLAGLGHQVTVCETAPVAGGKLGGFSRTTEAGTFTFDTGPTLLTLPHVFADLFTGGTPFDELVGLHRLDPIARYRFADGVTVETTSDLTRQRQNFDNALGPGTGAAWQRVIDRGAAIWRAVEQPVFGVALSARTALGLGRRLARPADLRAVAPGRTLRGLGRTLLTDPRQRMMLDRYATYEGSDPRRAPAALAVVPYLEHKYGAWYVDGGLHRLAGALTARLVELGGALRLATAVERIGVEGGRVAYVDLAGGERLPADVVVSDADARVLYGRLNTSRRRPTPPADSLSGVVLLLGVRGAHPRMAHHTVLYGTAPYDDEFDAVFGRLGAPRPVEDPVLYVNAPDDPSVAPAGHRSVYVLVNAPRHGPDAVDWTSPELTERYAQQLLQQLADRGVDLRPDLVSCDVRTPADLERLTGAPGGAIYGQVQHGALATLRRPHNRSLTRGLFLVGGSTHPGGGLPLVALSAAVVAGAIGAA